jgi:hypothetical protein
MIFGRYIEGPAAQNGPVAVGQATMTPPQGSGTGVVSAGRAQPNAK